MLRRLSMATLTMLLAGFARLAGAQAITGTIDGRVTDSSGGVLPGVTITVTNTATTATATVATTRDGLYRVPYLPPGPYDVRADLSGFRTETKQGVVVRVNDSAVVDFTLIVAPVSETITVQATPASVQLTRSELKRTYDDATLRDLAFAIGHRCDLQLNVAVVAAMESRGDPRAGQRRVERTIIGAEDFRGAEGLVKQPAPGRLAAPRVEGRVRRLAQEHVLPRPDPNARPGTSRREGVHERSVRELSPDPRHAGPGHRGSRPHTSREPHDDRRRHVAAHARASRGVDRRSREIECPCDVVVVERRGSKEQIADGCGDPTRSVQRCLEAWVLERHGGIDARQSGNRVP